MNFNNLFDEIRKFKATHDIYIYGCGSYGRSLYKILTKNDIHPDGYVVTSKAGEKTGDVPIYNIYEIVKKEQKSLLVLALNGKNTEEVMAHLKETNYDMNYVIDGGKYFMGDGEHRDTRNGSIEITTTMGCKVNCKFCPQSLLLNEYYKNDKNRATVMSLETFRKAMDYFPIDYDVLFCGMSEPFLNPDCIEMLKIACAQNRKVSLYTTLVGINKEQVDEILSLPLSYVTVHVADKKRFAHIDTTEEYYEILEKFVKAKKADGSYLVNACSSQTEPDERVLKICNGRFEIQTEMTDRAGNLEDKCLISKEIETGKIICGHLGDALNNNILLPDGSVVLCCMDFGLKHILGNIYDNTYNEIMNSTEIQRIKSGMAGDTSIDILCRSCSHARKVL